MASTRPSFGPKLLTKRQASFELVVAGFFWGFGFVATQWALRIFSAPETLVLRFLLAFIFGETFRFLFLRNKHQESSLKSLIKPSMIAGTLLGSCLLLQTTGLIFTSASNSGFITCLYIVLVPVFGYLFFKQRIIKGLWLYVLIALVGAFLMMGGNFEQLNQGDLWTLACSIFAAFHIIYIGFATDKIKDGFRFNNYQNLMAMILLIPTLFLPAPRTGHLDFHNASLGDLVLPFFGLFMIAAGGSTFAFYLQIRTQKVLSASEASMLFLLESPFAMISGAIFMQDQITLNKLSGAALILMAAVLTLRSESKTANP